MRPTRTATDLEYWTQSQDYWKKQEEFWFLEGAASKDPAWTVACQEREEHARRRQFAVNLAWQEVRGDLVVYTGRRNPKWVRQGVFAA